MYFPTHRHPHTIASYEDFTVWGLEWRALKQLAIVGVHMDFNMVLRLWPVIFQTLVTLRPRPLTRNQAIGNVVNALWPTTL